MQVTHLSSCSQEMEPQHSPNCQVLGDLESPRWSLGQSADQHSKIPQILCAVLRTLADSGHRPALCRLACLQGCSRGVGRDELRVYTWAHAGVHTGAHRGALQRHELGCQWGCVQGHGTVGWACAVTTRAGTHRWHLHHHSLAACELRVPPDTLQFPCYLCP